MPRLPLDDLPVPVPAPPPAVAADGAVAGASEDMMLVRTSELVSEEEDAQRIRATDWLQAVKVLALAATPLAAVDNIGYVSSCE